MITVTCDTHHKSNSNVNNHDNKDQSNGSNNKKGGKRAKATVMKTTQPLK